jgi:hypothetical protein
MSVLEWAKNRYYYPEFDQTKIQNILHFAIVWNIFERECCGSNAQINTHVEAVASVLHEKSIPSLDTTWGYFHQRYVRNENMTAKFDSFVFKGNDNKTFVQNALLSESPSKKDKIEALMRIIFRLRNNLMHGEKKPEIFYAQDENFKYANQFLMNVCDLFTDRQCPLEMLL